MTVTIMPLNDSPIADAASWATLAGNWLGDGVVRGVRNELAVTAGTGMAVQIDTGRAMLQGVVVDSDAVETVTLEAADAANDRIDLIVARVDFANGTAQSGFYVVTGTPAVTPTAPSVTQVTGSVWEIALAEVYVAAGATGVSASDITDRREYATTANSNLADLTDVDVSGATAGQALIYDGTNWGSVAGYLGTTRTINIATTDDAQAVLDAADHYVKPGETVNIVLADGTHTRTSPLYIRGWYGGGTLIVTSAAGDTTLHTTQPVTLDFTGAACWGVVVEDCTVTVQMIDVKVLVDDGEIGIVTDYDSPGKVKIYGCYIDGGGTSSSTAVFFSTQAYIRNTYINNCNIGINAANNNVIYARDCTYDTVQPVYGYSVSGVLLRVGTTITGSTADVVGAGLYT